MSRVILKFDPRGSGLIKISMSVSTPGDSEGLAVCCKRSVLAERAN